MARYEFTEGTSNKFWEIEVDAGKKVITRFGRIGTKGQQRVKSFKKNWEASRYKQQQIKAKMKKGYKMIRPGMPEPEPHAAWNPELESMIAEDPQRDEAYMVYADWLQAQGDSRGELIAVEQALRRKPGERKLLAARGRLRAPYDEQIIKLAQAYGMQVPPGEQHRIRLEWGLGFIESARLAHDWYGEMDQPDDMMETRGLFERFLALPSARLIQELTVGLWRDSEGSCDYSGVFAAVGASGPPALRRLVVGDFSFPDQIEISWTSLGDISPIYAGVPRLQELTLQGGSVSLGQIVLPELRSFEVRTGGLSRASVQSIASARWPELQRLVIWFGDNYYGAEGSVEEIRPILAGEGIPKLRHLGLMNAEFTDAICQALAGADVLDRLETLDLSMGLMSDDGAATLAAARPRMKNLRRLNVSENFLTDRSRPLLGDLAAEVVFGEQKEPDRWDDEEHRYVSVGE